MVPCIDVGSVYRALHLAGWFAAGYFHVPLGFVVELDWATWVVTALVDLSRARSRAMGKGSRIRRYLSFAGVLYMKDPTM